MELEEAQALEQITSLIDRIERRGPIIGVDKWNAPDGDGNDEGVPGNKKEGLRNFINSIRFGANTGFAASANHKSTRKTRSFGYQNAEDLVECLGGFTNVSYHTIALVGVWNCY